MLSVLGKAGDHVNNLMIIGNVFIEKVCKQLFSTKLMIRIILKEGQSYAKNYIEVQKFDNSSQVQGQ